MEPSLIATIILGGIGIGITGYYSSHTKKLAHEQMQKQLFTEFNKRYNELNDALEEVERSYPSIELLNQSPNSAELKDKIIDYFNLCAEEFFWYYHKKRIDKLVWTSWQAGMNYWYSIRSIQDLWQQEINANGKASYYITNDVEFFKPPSNGSWSKRTLHPEQNSEAIQGAAQVQVPR